MASASVSISVMLSKVYDPDKHDITGYYISEKYDGIRAVYLPDKKGLYSRNGNRFNVPDFFLKELADVTVQLDGELWAGHNKFSEAACVKMKVPDTKRWSNIKYMVFDTINEDIFAKRLAQITEICKDKKYVSVVEHIICTDPDSIYKELDIAVQKGSEGLMARHPKSYYEKKRSDRLLKIKQFYDEEAVVLSYEKGTGKYSDMIGAYVVKNDKDAVFSVGSGLTDEQRLIKNALSPGTKITYKYYGFSTEKTDRRPRHPIFLRIFE
jgi:DNA ligase-1